MSQTPNRKAPPRPFLAAAPEPRSLIRRLKDLAKGEGPGEELSGSALWPFEAGAPADWARLGFAAQTEAERTALLTVSVRLLEARPDLEAFQEHGLVYRRRALESGKTAALFAGREGVHPRMGEAAVEVFPRVARMARRFDAIFAALGDAALTTALWPNEAQADAGEKLRQMTYAQMGAAALGAGQYGFLRAAGFAPDMFGGYGSGELTALWAAEALDEEALGALLYARARAMTAADPRRPSATLRIQGEAAEIQDLIDRAGLRLAITHYEAPRQQVVGGDAAHAEVFQQLLRAKRLAFEASLQSAAFHSPRAEIAAASFAAALRRTRLSTPRLVVYAGETGAPYGRGQEAAGEVGRRLERQLLKPLRFQAMIERMYDEGARIFVEFGPGDGLLRRVKAILAGREHLAVSVDSGEPGRAARRLMEAAAALAAAGARFGVQERAALPAAPEAAPSVAAEAARQGEPETTLLPELEEEGPPSKRRFVAAAIAEEKGAQAPNSAPAFAPQEEAKAAPEAEALPASATEQGASASIRAKAQDEPSAPEPEGVPSSAQEGTEPIQPAAEDAATQDEAREAAPALHMEDAEKAQAAPSMTPEDADSEPTQEGQAPESEPSLPETEGDVQEETREDAQTTQTRTQEADSEPEAEAAPQTAPLEAEASQPALMAEAAPTLDAAASLATQPAPATTGAELALKLAEQVARAHERFLEGQAAALNALLEAVADPETVVAIEEARREAAAAHRLYLEGISALGGLRPRREPLRAAPPAILAALAAREVEAFEPEVEIVEIVEAKAAAAEIAFEEASLSLELVDEAPAAESVLLAGLNFEDAEPEALSAEETQEDAFWERTEADLDSIEAERAAMERRSPEAELEAEAETHEAFLETRAQAAFEDEPEEREAPEAEELSDVQEVSPSAAAPTDVEALEDLSLEASRRTPRMISAEAAEAVISANLAAEARAASATDMAELDDQPSAAAHGEEPAEALDFAALEAPDAESTTAPTPEDFAPTLSEAASAPLHDETGAQISERAHEESASDVAVMQAPEAPSRAEDAARDAQEPEAFAAPFPAPDDDPEGGVRAETTTPQEASADPAPEASHAQRPSPETASEVAQIAAASEGRDEASPLAPVKAAPAAETGDWLAMIPEPEAAGALPPATAETAEEDAALGFGFAAKLAAAPQSGAELIPTPTPPHNLGAPHASGEEPPRLTRLALGLSPLRAPALRMRNAEAARWLIVGDAALAGALAKRLAQASEGEPTPSVAMVEADDSALDLFKSGDWTGIVYLHVEGDETQSLARIEIARALAEAAQEAFHEPAARGERRVFAAAARLDGALGYGPAPRADLGAAAFGLVKALAVAEPNFFCRALDLAEELPLEQAAALLAEELADADRTRVELALNAQGRFEIRPQHPALEPASEGAPDEAEILVLLGDARGVATLWLEEAAAQAPRRFLLLGGHRLLADEPAWAIGLESEESLRWAAFQALEAEGVEEERAAVGAVALCEAVTADRETRACLAELRRLGSAAAYATVDFEAPGAADQIAHHLGEFGEGPVSVFYAPETGRDDGFSAAYARRLRRVETLMDGFSGADLRRIWILPPALGVEASLSETMAEESVRRFALGARSMGIDARALSWAYAEEVESGVAEVLSRELGLPAPELGIALIGGAETTLWRRRADMGALAAGGAALKVDWRALLGSEAVAQHRVAGRAALPVSFALAAVFAAIERFAPGWRAEGCDGVALSNGVTLGEDQAGWAVVGLRSAEWLDEATLRADIELTDEGGRARFRVEGARFSAWGQASGEEWRKLATPEDSAEGFYADKTLHHGPDLRFLRALAMEEGAAEGLFAAQGPEAPILGVERAARLDPILAEAMAQSALAATRRRSGQRGLLMRLEGLSVWGALAAGEEAVIEAKLLRESSKSAVWRLLARSAQGEPIMAMDAAVMIPPTPGLVAPPSPAAQAALPPAQTA